jgi:hypothetical protein
MIITQLSLEENLAVKTGRCQIFYFSNKLDADGDDTKTVSVLCDL